jgi:hypothetical protein
MSSLPSAAFAGDSQSYKVEINKTEILRLPGAAASIIIGNPSIADVTVQASDLIFVVGRGYGETNLIILDGNGNTMMDADVQVVNSLPTHGVRLYNGTSRQTYSCIPYCGPSPVLGDASEFIGNNTAEANELTSFTAFSSSSSSSASQEAARQNASEAAGAPAASQSRQPN